MNIKSFIYWKLVYPIMNASEKLKGLDFLSPILAEDAGLDPTLSYTSAPSSNLFLKDVLSDFNISSTSSILDVGCGKGSAMRLMLEFPFGKVDGIEFSSHIANIAMQNFKRLKSTKSNIFVGDASKFHQYDAYDFVYFFNPFPATVMAEVINSLIESVQRTDRELVIIYMNPTCDEVIVNSDLFQKVGFYKRNESVVTVYSNRDHSNSILSANQRIQRSVEEYDRIRR